MCKIWGCAVDDPRIQNITSVQWAWYGLMIAEEKENDYKTNLGLVEYLASFVNSEAVRKIRDMREAEESGRFMDDEEFDTFVRDGLFKNTEELDSILNKGKNTNLDKYNTGISKDARSRRVPGNLSSVVKLTED
tara:strand:- start:315 stop:716 length:402 start_codon:yes stop_codon:yes gene_type:complete